MPTLDEMLSGGPPQGSPRQAPAGQPRRGSGQTLDEMLTGGTTAPKAQTPVEIDPLKTIAESGAVPGLSGILLVMDRLAAAGSQGAGGVAKAIREGTYQNIPVNYVTGLWSGVTGGKAQPELIDELHKAGFKESPVPEFMTQIPGPTGAVSTAARLATSPEAAAMAGGTVATMPLDLVGGAIMKGARALTAIPKVAEALDVARGATAPVGNLLSRGYAIPSSARAGVREAFTEAGGKARAIEAGFSDLIDEAQNSILAAAKARGVAPEVAEDQVRHLMEVAKRNPDAVAAALPEERQAALALRRLSESMPFEREAANLKARRLGGTEGPAPGEAEFTPRIFREKAAKQLGFKGSEPVDYSEAAARVPGIRSAEKHITTEELESAFKAGVGERGSIEKPFEPLLQAFQIRAGQTARSVANAGAIQSVAKKFAVSAEKAGPGFRKLSDLKILQGFTDEAKAPLLEAYIHPEIYRYMDEFTRHVNPQSIPLLSGFLKVWKPLVTTVNPQFVSRNMQWNGIIGWIRGNRDPRNWTDAAKILGRANGQEVTRGFKVANEALRKEMLEGRVVGQGTMAEFGVSGRRILHGAERWNLPARAARIGTRANQAGEDLARAAFYLAMRRKGMTAREAAKQVALTYFDYGRDATTAFLNGLRGSAVPFVIWARNILPLTFRSLIENPSAFAGIGAVGRESARAAGLSQADRARLGPEYKETVGIAMKPSKADRQGTFRAVPLSQVGYFDVSRALTDPRKWVMTQLSPAITLPLETAGIIKNALTGKQSDAIVELPGSAAAFAKLNPEVAMKLGITLAGEDRAVGPQWMNAVLRAGGPLGTTVFDLFSKDEKARDRVVRWFTGIGVRRNLDPRLGEQIERSIEAGKARDVRSKERTRQGITGQIERGER